MLEKFKEIQNKLLLFIDRKDNVEENFQNFITLFDPELIHKYLLLVLHLISQISNFHHREGDFIPKIEKIILYFKEEIKQKYINSVIYNIFKSNKRILLFLIKNEILTVDKYIAQQMMKKFYKKMKYPQYFFPEIKSLLSSIREICEEERPSFFHSEENENEIFEQFKIEFQNIYQKILKKKEKKEKIMIILANLSEKIELMISYHISKKK